MTVAQISFENKVAIVTGGGTGIGFATARQFAALGASVVIASRGAEELAQSAAAIERETGSRCRAIPTDVKDEGRVAALVTQTLEAFGRIDILVNNAGGSRMMPLSQLPPRAWDASFNLNVRAAYLCTAAVGEAMRAQGSGAIVNISSNAGSTGVKGGAHYSAAKAALQMFTTVTAAEWGHHGIRVNCVAAGMIASPRAVEGWKVAKLDTDNLTAIPLRRPGTPEEVANAVVFLASDAASYITGQTLAVNGGPSMGGIQAC